jgi:hypothetical protein
MSLYRSFNETKEQQKLIKMRPSTFDKFMCQKFKLMFSERYFTIQESCMAWGFDIPAGWRPVLFELCQKLDILCRELAIELTFTQIKEKFGSARFYYRPRSKETRNVNDFSVIEEVLNDLVSKYEHSCFYINKDSGQFLNDEFELDKKLK